ncbi:MAG: hypothetical protein FJ290_20650 [Planctomycetes bacterium]|nr:hypothetical protein [Planctomycetota bacterium]
MLIDACKVRLKADYGPRRTVTVEKAAELIQQAEYFLEIADERFGSLPPAGPAQPPSGDTGEP